MREIGSGLWQATARLGDDPAGPFADALEEGAAGVSIFETGAGQWSATALYRREPDRGNLTARLALAAAAYGLAEPELEIAKLPPADWLELAYAGFPARDIGRFYVHGSHVAAPAGRNVPLHIDAATAFGSGEHASTEGCLRAISDLKRSGARVWRVLDMGTGSGILAIGAAKLFPRARVAAIDIDAESARVAALNARLNQVGVRVRAIQGNGYVSPLAARGPRFDLIVANILARPLIRMAPSLGARLRPGGVAILSGLLRRQEAAVLSAHYAAGLRLKARKEIGEWTTLVLRRG
jgi:ribosomal protein L11 methyltransferase